MRRARIIAAIVGLVAGLFLVAPAASAQRTYPTCNLPESDAEALYILNAIYPNRYVWDDASITVAVQAAPNVGEEYVDAAQDAIAAWAEVIEKCFDGLITLTDVTDDPTNPQSADIVLHYVPNAGGSVFAGYAICGANGCPNILVRSEFATGLGIEGAWYLSRTFDALVRADMLVFPGDERERAIHQAALAGLRIDHGTSIRRTG